jgi:hypothetical protein
VPTKVPPAKAPKPKKQSLVHFQPESEASLSAPETPSRSEVRLQLKVPPGVHVKPKRKPKEESPER